MKSEKKIIYPIEKETVQGRHIIIKAGKSWTDNNRVLQYEGITLKIPKEIRSLKEFKFAVLGIRQKSYEEFVLNLHGHSDFHEGEIEPYDSKEWKDDYEYSAIDLGGDVEVGLSLNRKMFNRIIGIYGDAIESSFGKRGINVGNTYNLLASLPRIIAITKNSVIIEKGQGKHIDPMVCNRLFDGNYPLDKIKKVDY